MASLVGTEVTLTIDGPNRASFRCPDDHRKVVVVACFPFMWGYKRCPKCQRVWTLVDHLVGIEDTRRADELPLGYSKTIRIYAPEAACTS